MTYFHYLNKREKGYYINSRVPFSPIETLDYDLVETVFDFAYQMTFGQSGEHRAHRSGGTHQRRTGEIFASTFQGKLAEFALYHTLKNCGIDASKPDLNIYGLGKWDSVDLTIGNESISIKSTKSFGDLLLLEEQDWDKQANYLPNGHGYDYTFLIRMQPFCEDVMRKNRCLYSDNVDEATIKQIIMAQSWSFDIPGYVTKADLIQIINNGYILPKGTLLNGNTRMDASNYYIQSGDMRSLDSFLTRQI